MSIEIRISGTSANEIAGHIAALHEQFQSPAEAPAEPVAAPKRGRPKKQVTIEGEVVEDAPVAETGASADDAGRTDEAPAESGGADAGGDREGSEHAADDEPAEVDAVAGIDVDTLRKFTVNEYLNTCFEDQPTRSAKFRELLDEFGIAKLAELPADKAGEFKALVDRKIEEAAS